MNLPSKAAGQVNNQVVDLPGSSASPAHTTQTKPKAFRGDIQGLRAIAVSMVVIYHLWPTSLTGGFIGVDVFFVISGFLITSHLMKRPPKSWADFVTFWIRRVKRLLPASFLVLGLTLAAIPLLAPTTVWKEWATQIVSSTFYVQNWRLATTSVDYLAADNAVSAVQHFWSLSVEEQFYLFWPLIIAGLVALAFKLRKNPSLVVAIGISGLIAVSLIHSATSTLTQPEIAYFSTFTRAWELATGALVAVLPPAAAALRGSPLGGLLAWVGLGAIAVAGFTFTSATVFPGYSAALPVVGTALVIWAHATHRTSPNSLLGHPVSRFIGDHSYSIYLWHWPLIVFVPFVIGELGWLDKFAILGVTIALSILSKRYVEDRFRTYMDSSKILTGGRFLLVGTLLLGILGTSVVMAGNSNEQTGSKLEQQIQQVREQVGANCFGAAAMLSSCANTGDSPLVPTPAAAKNDKSQAYADKCWAGGDFTNRPTCKYGSGSKQVALVGNSHAGQWLPALTEIAERQDWTITTYLASNCAPTSVLLDFNTSARAQGCLDYGKWVQKQTSTGDFDLIVFSNRQSLAVAGFDLESTEAPAIDGYAKYLAGWQKAETPVLVIRDTPFPAHTVSNIPDCLASSQNPMKDCAGTPDSWHSLDPLTTAADSLKLPFVKTVSLNEYFCSESICPPVIGSVVPYFDGSHLTETFARTLSEKLEAKITGVLPGL